MAQQKHDKGHCQKKGREVVEIGGMMGSLGMLRVDQFEDQFYAQIDFIDRDSPRFLMLA